MFSLPLLISEDIAALDSALGDFVASSGVRLALVIDCGGFIVNHRGDASGIDTATLGALAANSFAATQAIARIIDDHAVTSLYQEGQESSLLILTVDDSGYLVAVFPSEIGVGAVKYYSQEIVTRVARQFAEARLRAPSEGLDLAAINLEDTAPLFRRRAAP
jgi:predicted regulator of Ras-like GTPase activity (Roadblock/LC7/MglB family)